MTEELIALATRPSRGKRPSFCPDPLTERLFGMVLGLATELSVTRQRLDSLERLLAREGTLAAGAVDGYTPDEQVAAERAAELQRALAVIFRPLLQDQASERQ
ncbi:MAG: hypothetical protein JJT85_12080 [Chromatiales bacterium]|nr:hypothetical protein [Chromatiales bacterium]